MPRAQPVHLKSLVPSVQIKWEDKKKLQRELEEKEKQLKQEETDLILEEKRIEEETNQKEKLENWIKDKEKQQIELNQLLLPFLFLLKFVLLIPYLALFALQYIPDFLQSALLDVVLP